MALLNPLFLLGLAAVAAPIIVHLVRRTRSQKVEFPSLMFVRQVPQRTIRRRTLHNLLLLLLRTLAFLLLALAFTRPYFGTGSAESERGQRTNVILLDTSFSMRYGKHFEQAKSRAKALIDETRGNERFALVSFGNSYEVLSRFTNDTAKLNSLVDAAQAGLGGTDYTQALRGSETLFKEANTANKRVLLISDFQANGHNKTDASFRVSKDIKLVTIDVGEQNAPNLAVTDVAAQPLIYQAKYSDKLTARIANFSDEAKESVRVELNLNDHVVEKRELKIAAHDSATVEFTGFNLNEGVNRGVIQIEGDTFPVDNRFFFTLRRAEQLKALVIETASRGRSESFFLRNALTTGENLPFALTVKTAGSVNPGELNESKVILLNDAAINAALAQSLLKFVEAGGGLVISAGPHTEASDLNSSLQPLLPAQLDQQINLRGEYVSLSDVKTDHPVFEVFRQSGRLASARVFNYWRATPKEASTILARFEDGSPALIERNYGTGKVLLLTSTFDSSWNDLPLSPLYLPLVRQMARYLGEREERGWYGLGQTFTVRAAKNGEPPAVDIPSGERLTERNLTTGGELLVQARENGFYRLRYPENNDFTAVNLDSKESDLARLNVDEFVAAVTGADVKDVVANAANEKLSKEEIEAKQRVWWLLLIGALLLFVTEAVLARRTKTARVIG
jgi:hypothetical protein